MVKLDAAFALLYEKLIFSFCEKAPVDSYITERHLRGVLPETSGGGVRPASQNPYSIFDSKSAIFPNLTKLR